MTPDSGYTLQKLELAAIDLATGKGNIKTRLYDVYTEHLHIIMDIDLPPELRQEWLSIKSDLTKSGQKVDSDGKIYFGALQNTLKSMRLKKGSEIASNIVLLAEKLRAQIESKN